MNFFRNFLFLIILPVQFFHMTMPMAQSIVVSSQKFASKSELLSYQYVAEIIQKPELLNDNQVVLNLMLLEADILRPLLATHMLPQFTVLFIKASSDDQFLDVLEKNVDLIKHPDIQKRFYSLSIDKIISFITQPQNVDLIEILGKHMPETLLKEILLHEQAAQSNIVFDSLRQIKAKPQISMQLSIPEVIHSIPAMCKEMITSIINKIIEFHYGSKKVEFTTENFIRDIAYEMGMTQSFCIKQIKNSGIKNKNNTIAFTFGRHLFINESALTDLSSKEKRFIIGHELAHMFHEHSYQRLRYIAGYAALKGIDFYSLYYCQQKFIETDSKTKQLCAIASAASVYLMNFLVKRQVLKLAQQMMHEQEFEADAMAVEKLQARDGAIRFFQRNILTNRLMQDYDTISHPSLSKRSDVLFDPNRASSSIELMNQYTLNNDLQSSVELSPECGALPFFAAPVLLVAGYSVTELAAIGAGYGLVAYGYVKIGKELYFLYKDNKKHKKNAKKSNDPQGPKKPKDPKEIPPIPKITSDKSSNKSKRLRASSSQAQDKTRVTDKSTSAELLKNTALGDMVRGKVSVKVHGKIKTYKIQKKIDHPHLKKGDNFQFDFLHGDHVEVFDSRGRFKCVLNTDGTINVAKTDAAGLGRSINI